MKLWIGVGIGILASGFFTYLFSKRYSREKILKYIVSERGSIVPKIELPGGELRYNNVLINRLSYIDIAFGNIGRDVIDNRTEKGKFDVVEPLKIVFPSDLEGGIIDNPYIVEESRKAIALCASKESEKVVTIKFIFLDHMDGGKIKILHTFEPNVPFSVEGSIVGLSGDIREYKPIFDFREWIRFFVALLVLLIEIFAARLLLQGHLSFIFFIAISVVAFAVIGLPGRLIKPSKLFLKK